MSPGTVALRQVWTATMLIVCLNALRACFLIDLILFFRFIPHAPQPLHHGKEAQQCPCRTVLVWHEETWQQCMWESPDLSCAKPSKEMDTWIINLLHTRTTLAAWYTELVISPTPPRLENTTTTISGWRAAVWWHDCTVGRCFFKQRDLEDFSVDVCNVCRWNVKTTFTLFEGKHLDYFLQRKSTKLRRYRLILLALYILDLPDIKKTDYNLYVCISFLFQLIHSIEKRT